MPSPRTTTKRPRTSSVGLAVALVVGLLGCGRIPEFSWGRDGASRVFEARDEPRVRESAVAPPTSPGAPTLCAVEIERLAVENALPGAPDFEARRPEILGRARATPRLFVREPETSAELPAHLAPFRAALASDAEDPAPAISEFLRKTRRDLPARRALFLREGYLYSEHPFTALRMVQMLRLDHLFHEPEVRVERRGLVRVARREEGRYWFFRDDGTRDEAHLLLLDRVSLASDGERAPIHLDLETLAREVGASRVHVDRFTDEGHVARFEYRGDHEAVFTRAVVAGDERGVARLVCEDLPRERWAEVAEAKRLAFRERELVRPILAAVERMVELALPFDEPKTEEGQQDGKLRVEFRDAYLHGRSKYEFNGDEYFVFDGLGRPRLPQVCIDFITDALDWATGGGWAARGQGRARTKGALHFPAFGLENSRSVEQVAEFAILHPEWFDVWQLDEAERIPLYKRPEFFGSLAKNWSRYRVGDIVFINGLRSDERFHYHSFFVAERDPVSGMPIVLAANAGRPQFRTWEGEMVAAPRRYVVARVRVRASLLERAYERARTAPGVPLELARADDEIVD